MTNTTVQVSAAQFRALFDEVSTWDGRSTEAQRGALRNLTPERLLAAAGLVRSGTTVTLGRRVDTQARLDNPAPAVHLMTMLPDVEVGTGSVRFAKDYIGVDYHNDTHSHLDALCHVAFDGRLYGGESEQEITSRGSAYGAIDLLDNGLVGRGVLLDIPRVRDAAWIEPGEHVFRADLEAAEREQGVTVGPGDILLVRTGHARRLAELGPWETGQAKAGLHPSTATYFSERRIAALGSDGNSDTAPSSTEGVGFPIHVLAINAMGIHLLDYLQFEDLVEHCESHDVWEFLFVAAPLRIPGGTGSPVNPLAIL